MSTTRPLCIRYPNALLELAEQHAANAGTSLTEWIREQVYRAVYGEPQSPTEGFEQGKRAGIRLAIVAIQETVAQLPQDPDEAFTAFRAINAAPLTRG